MDSSAFDDREPASTSPAAQGSSNLLPGIPRISLDMPPMEPTPAKSGSSHLERHEEGDREEVPVPPTYARLNSEA
jgi:hypothetical protein